MDFCKVKLSNHFISIIFMNFYISTLMVALVFPQKKKKMVALV